MAIFTTYIALAVIQASDSYWLGFVAALGIGLVLGAAVEGCWFAAWLRARRSTP